MASLFRLGVMITYDLLKILSDGRFHSGARLGEKLGVSRSAVWKNVGLLQDQGVLVDSVRGKGYRLQDPVLLLQDDEVRHHLPRAQLARVRSLAVHYSLDSTNEELARQLAGDAGMLPEREVSLCLAETQTAGRGRRGRHWMSSPGDSLCFSLLRCFPRGLVGVECLGLVTGIAVVRALKRLGAQRLGLKWPNDVVVDGRKLAGVLLEMHCGGMGEYQIIFGIGVNTRQSRALEEVVDQPWLALDALMNAPVDRNRLSALLVSELLDCVDQFEKDGFAAFREEWACLDCTAGRQVTVHMADGSRVSGRACGISAQGGLQVETAEGLRLFNGGEVSLRVKG